MDEAAEDRSDEKAENKAEEKSAEKVDDNIVTSESAAANADEAATVEPVLATSTNIVSPTTSAAVVRKPLIKEELSTLDLATGVLLLVILSLLVTNSYVVFLGKSYNERICREAIALAGEAANKGSDTQHIQVAAMGPWEHCPLGGFFIEQPLFAAFSDDISDDASLRVITIAASTKVRIPAPALLFDKSRMDPDQQMFQQITFQNSYQYRLSNPKGVRGKLIKTPHGYVVAPSKKNEAPAARTNAPSSKTDKPEAKPKANP